MSSENATEVIVGGGVLAVAAGFLIFASQATGFFGGQASSYELRAAFPSVEGVRVGTDVRMAGVKVGSVTALDLNPQTFMAELRFSVREGIELPEDSAAVISSEGLLGGNFLELMPGGSDFNLAAGSEVEDTQGSVSLTTLLMKFVGGGSDEAEAETTSGAE